VERTTEPKIVLLVRLLNAIDEGRHSFESLKDRISEDGRRPSTRSLRRYLAVLSDAGFPWYFDRTTNTYRFADGYSLKRLDLSNDELFGLVALRSFSASLGGAIGQSINEIAEKVVVSSNGARSKGADHSPVAFRLSEIRLDENGERVFGLLSAAERASRSVRFVYEDKEGNRTSREADPYGFIVSSGRIYCVAFDRGRNDKRVFAIDNITDLQTLAHTFVRPHDFDVEEFAASSISGVMHAADTTAIRVRFDARVAKAAVAARVVAERKIEHANDGGVEIEYRVADVDEFVRWILGWGAQAEIVGPPDVRERIAALAGHVAAMYVRPLVSA
jgi:proteasome accessory factor B